jgi:predicted ATPase/class 3 adenylate cyclase
VRRFLVGDPEYILMDVIAGDTLVKLATAEGQANRGEIVLDADTAANLGDILQVTEWRVDEASDQRFAVITHLEGDVPESPWPNIAPDALSDEVTQAWLLPRIHERLRSGLGEFLAELRPVVALFLRFGGIDYDNDPEAHEKLDTFVGQVEQIFMRYDATATHLTIGDKGSYFCVAFGAPVSHEDDPIRATSAALELHATAARLDYIEDLQIGITQGSLWIGAYGGRDRRTYDVLGDAANLSARLMSIAAPGQTLGTWKVRDATSEAFDWEAMPRIRVKGKSKRLEPSQLLGVKSQSQAHLHIPEYSLPMVGRATELKLIEEKLALAISGKGQIVGIKAEAGLGKSRLAAEAIHQAREKGFVGYAGECQSYGTSTSYLLWQDIWRAFFGLDSNAPVEGQVHKLEQELQSINPALLGRLPLLGVVVNLPISDNDLTGSLSAKLRKSSLESMLVECLQRRANTRPILLVLEDCHWLDPLSHDLIEVIGRAIVNQPVLILMMYRPAEQQRLEAPRVSALPHFTEINLNEFSPEEANQLIQMKLAQFFGPDVDASPALLERITNQAQGNPFYIEELINYFQNLGIDPTDSQALATLDLPDSVHNLVLSRLGQLTEREQITLKVASVLGRLFKAAMVWGVYPQLGDETTVQANLDEIRTQDLTVLDIPDPELTYLFKHVFTQQVAYESLLYSTRAMLHETIGGYIEREYHDSLDQQVFILAHHYENSENQEKKREYLLKAGEAAQRDYANAGAINYYEKALPLLTIEDHTDVTLKLGEVQELIGDFQEAARHYDQALSQSKDLGDRRRQAWVEAAKGEFLRKQGKLAEASEILEHASKLFEEVDDLAGKGQVLHFVGTIADQSGDFEEATRLMTESLHIRQQLGDQRQIASMLANLGIVAARQGQLEKAQSLWEQSLELRREIGDRWGVANILNNLGFSFLEIGDLEAARTRLEEAVVILRELGDRWYIGNALNNLGNVVRNQGEFAVAKEQYNESLEIYAELGDKWALAYLFEDVACLAALQGDGQRALHLCAAASVLREEINAPLTSHEAEKLNATLEPARKRLPPGEDRLADSEGKSMNLEEAIRYALS